ncbi:flavodoxin family protein, partial [Salmonella enterica subsp. enterica]|nr:flavodoxin family protein [Salmonella enterica subsp. enterica serovar Enteritidis]
MRCLLVHAHPLDKSLTRHFLDVAASTLEAAGHDVDSLDLYQAGFNPRLTAAERVTHYALPFDRSALTREIAQLEAAELLVLVFPTWWFGPPAILKGWID